MRRAGPKLIGDEFAEQFQTDCSCRKLKNWLGAVCPFDESKFNRPSRLISTSDSTTWNLNCWPIPHLVSRSNLRWIFFQKA